MSVSTQALESLLDFVGGWAREHVGAGSLAEAEVAAEAVRRACGEAVLTTAMRQQSGRATYRGTRLTCECGGEARFVGYRERWVKAVAGEVQVSRAYYHCRGCGRGLLPWDKEQGLDEQMCSPALKALVSELSGRMPYGEAMGLLERVGGVGVEESVAEAVVASVGQRLRAQEEQQVAQCRQEPEAAVPAEERTGRLYIGVDAAKAHIDGDWRDAKVATLYAGVPDGEGRDHPGRVEYRAAREESEAFGWRVYAAARALGLERYAEQVAIGDGAEFIWNQAALHFPQATQVLDFWHASQHVWELSRALYGAESAQGKRWAQERVRSLREEGPAPLLRALRRRKPRTLAGQEALRIERNYFTKNRRRMHYPAYRARGMMIGSGPVEAGCKTVVCQRMKQAGMRWSNDGADAMLAVRSALLSQDLAKLQQCARAA